MAYGDLDNQDLSYGKIYTPTPHTQDHYIKSKYASEIPGRKIDIHRTKAVQTDFLHFRHIVMFI